MTRTVAKTFKDVVCIILVAFLVVTMSPFMTDAVGGSGHVSAATTKGTANALVSVADSYRNLKGLNAVKSAMEKRGHSLWNKKYNDDWCAWFVSNCAKQAGLSKKIGYGVNPQQIALKTVNDKGGKVTFVYKKFYNAKKNQFNSKRVKYDKSYSPRKGDIIIYSEGNGSYWWSHVGIVASNCKKPDKNVHTIEGNTAGSHFTKSYVRNRPNLSSSASWHIVAYVTPNYPASAKPAAAAVSHTFSYALEGGSGTFKSQTVKDGAKFSIPSSKPSRSGQTFKGWYVKRNADSKWYVAGQGWCALDMIKNKKYTRKTYNPGNNLTLDGSWTKGNAKSSYTFYAQWAPVKSTPAKPAQTTTPSATTTKPTQISQTTTPSSSTTTPTKSGFMVSESEYNATYRGDSRYEATPMYRYATRSKSTTTDGHSSLSGWTKYDTKITTTTSGYVVGTPIATSSSYSGGKCIEKSAVDKGYYYYAYAVANPNKTSDWTYYVDTSRANVVSHMKKNFSNSKVWKESRLRYFWYVSSKDLGKRTGKLNVKTAYCDDSNVKKGTVSKDGTHKYDLVMWKHSQCYKVKTVTTTNYFYKWSGWSSWSDWTTAVKSTGDTVKRDSEVRYWIEAK